MSDISIQTPRLNQCPMMYGLMVSNSQPDAFVYGYIMKRIGFVRRRYPYTRWYIWEEETRPRATIRLTTIWVHLSSMRSSFALTLL